MAPPQFTQDDRPIVVTSPLGADVLLLESMRSTEALSRPYDIVLDLLSVDPAIDPDALLRKPMTVMLTQADGLKRYLHGLVRRFVQLGRNERFTSYRAEIAPTVWFLSLAADCRIFQQKTVPEIVKEVLNDLGITDVKLVLSGTYPKRDYCVQYRESHLAFISRLLEEEGIFYFFEHEKDKHTIVLADSPSAIKPGPVPALPMELGDGGGPFEARIASLEVEKLVGSGKVTLVDYVDTMPKRFEATTSASSRAVTSAKYRVFDYPGNFAAVSEGDKRAKVRMEEHEALTYVATGFTNSMMLGCGQQLDITGHYRRDFNKSYHIVSVEQMGRIGDISSGSHGTFSYETRFVAIPNTVTFRPPRTTPKSIVHGSQTAIVVGPPGEEIFVDKYGRVKVQFFWDQLGQKDDHSSCWVRVSSAWAGKTWGFIQIPRIGQEVIVDFLEGDPDRPIITGRVYNAEQMPPYDLPGNGTQSGLKTRSSKDGTGDNANELRFEDKKGSELVLFNAEKDLASTIENDETRDVLHDRTTTIKNDETKTVTEGNEATTISKGNRTFDITQGNETLTISNGDQTLTIAEGKQTVEINKDQATTIKKGDHALTVKEGNSSIAVSKGNLATKVDMGNVSLKAAAGKISYEAMQEIQFKVGSNTVTIDQTGIKIKGLMVSIEGSIEVKVKGTMTTVNGDAMLTLKGGITMIN